MTVPTCTDPGCQAVAIRTRDGNPFCLFHPDRPRPDLLTNGEPRQDKRAHNKGDLRRVGP